MTLRILLDTSAYSAAMRGHKQLHPEIQRADEIWLNPIVLGELNAGFLRGSRSHKNQEELRSFLASPRVEVLPVDAETSERYAVIRNALWKAGTPVPTNDIWIAASAMQHGLTILTTDAHYKKIPHVLLLFFEAG